MTKKWSDICSKFQVIVTFIGKYNNAERLKKDNTKMVKVQEGRWGINGDRKK